MTFHRTPPPANRRTTPTWNLADRLRKVRREILGLTQDQMADELGVGVKRYSAWEAGRNNPTDLPALSIRLEALSGIDRAWFVWDEEGAPIRPTTRLIFDEGIRAEEEQP